MNFPWAAMARVGLARAYAMQSDTAKAKAAYQDFLALERRRPRHSRLHRSEGGVRETEIDAFIKARESEQEAEVSLLFQF